MDLREYYGLIAEQEALITDALPIVVSLKTSNGGRAGFITEVVRAVAARMIVDKQYRLATPDEAVAHRAEQERVREQTTLNAMRGRLNLAVLSDEDLRTLRELRGSE